jgi:hypothetical protein
MGFNKKITEDSLIACGRHCCLCHKFCGTKIELHHIKQMKDDGEDSLDNCLPLCFDCHADVMQYNPNHPKGKKYTETELKRHRNNWFEKIKKSEGSAITESSYLNLDKVTFQRLNELLDSKKLMYFIKQNNFVMGSFPDKIYQDIHSFLVECELPEFEFIDADLEGVKSELKENLEKLDKLITKHTFSAGPGKQGIPREWESNNPERFDMAIDDFTVLAPIISDNYETLIKLGRRKLFAN